MLRVIPILWLFLTIPMFPQRVRESFVPTQRPTPQEPTTEVPAPQETPRVVPTPPEPVAPPQTNEVYIVNTNDILDMIREQTAELTPELVIQDHLRRQNPEIAPSPVMPRPVTAADTRITQGPQPFIPINGIVLDAGHGGKDPGAIGNGIREKWLVMSVVKQLHSKFRLNKKNLNIYVTRKNDTFLSLEERVSKTARWSAPKTNNILFVSIHGNSSPNRRAEGFEIYTLSERASDPEALEVERLENAGFSKEDIDQTQNIYSLLADLIRDGTRKQSEWLAGYVYNATIPQIQPRGGVGRGAYRKANFFVLKYNTVPSILIEIGYISNPAEANRLKEPEYHDMLAEGMYKGIARFIDEYNTTQGFTTGKAGL
ncbi:MAG: N-acetylmuramoyl-L-alanine amidase family protein [Brevinema sp.]